MSDHDTSEAGGMKSLHIRHIPDELHRLLKERAAMEGISLNAYALKHLQRSARQPTKEEIFERFRQRSQT